MLTFLLLAAAAGADSKTMANDDWHSFAITGVSNDISGPLYLRVKTGDLDGDGTPDDAVLRLACAAGKLTSASYVVSPREASSGMATGRRQYAPVKIVKEWGAASPELQKIRPQYDVKAMKGNERMADGWTSVTLSGVDGLCAATQAAAAAIVKSKSNITNN